MSWHWRISTSSPARCCPSSETSGTTMAGSTTGGRSSCATTWASPSRQPWEGNRHGPRDRRRPMARGRATAPGSRAADRGEVVCPSFAWLPVGPRTELCPTIWGLRRDRMFNFGPHLRAGRDRGEIRRKFVRLSAGGRWIRTGSPTLVFLLWDQAETLLAFFAEHSNGFH